MKPQIQNESNWPSLPYEAWHETLDTLHLMMQVIGKIKLQTSIFVNHYWEVAFFLNARGMTTGRMPYRDTTFEIAFDFINHTLTIFVSNGRQVVLPLQQHSVASFFDEVMALLSLLHLPISITNVPSEIQHPIPFTEDRLHRTYDSEYVKKWWKILLNIHTVFDEFRMSFYGKSSPVLFYWGSFDLNQARYSGKKLADKTDWPKGYSFMRYAENEENFSYGFWPGDERYPHPAFYSYLYPAPKGSETIVLGPAYAYFNTKLAECILPYEDVRKANKPEEDILHFLQTTYREYAKLAGWDISAYEGSVPSSL